MEPKQRIELLEEIMLINKANEKALLYGLENICIIKGETTNTGEGFVKELKDFMFEQHIKHKYPKASVVKKLFPDRIEFESEVSELNEKMDEISEQIKDLRERYRKQ